MLTPKDIIKLLNLQANPVEGGYFSSIYNSTDILPDSCLPSFAETDHGRPISGAIYYFLDNTGCSIMHRVTGDMLYHFYMGDPVEMLLLYPKNFPIRSEICIFSNDLAAGGSLVKVIPGGTWLGSRCRLAHDGTYALMGVTMAPGFEPKDYSIGDRNKLIEQYPEQEAMIKALTLSKNSKSVK